MEKTNFEKHIEWFEENDLLRLYESIRELETQVFEFEEKYNEENKLIKSHNISAGIVRDIGETICEYLFEMDLARGPHSDGYDLNHYKNENFNSKITFLNKEKIVKDKHILNMLYEIKEISNAIAHYRKGNVDKTYNYVGKAMLVNMLNYIYIVISWMDDKTKEINFDSSSYFGRNQKRDKVDTDIKETVKLVEDKGIEINGASLLNMLYDDIKYNIPLYQRGYDWGKKELDDLIFDIEKRSNENFESYHFFGNVSLISEVGKNCIKVIDGQQRFTTSIILLKSIYNRLLEMEHSKNPIDENLKSFISSDLKIDRVDNEITMKTIIKIWNGDLSFNELEMKTNAYYAFQYFETWLNSKETDEIEKYIEALSKFIIGINWIKRVNEFELFESLNAKGKKLSNFDIFKNYLYSLIDGYVEKKHEKEITSIFENYILKKFDILSKTKQISAKDNFMQFFIEYILDENESKKTIFNTFKKALNTWLDNKSMPKANLDLDDFKLMTFELSKIIDASLLTLNKDIGVWSSYNVLSEFVDDAFYIIASPGYSKVLFHYFVNSGNLIYNEYSASIQGLKDSEELRSIIKMIEIWRVRREVSYNFGATTMGSMIPPFLKKWKKVNSDYITSLQKLIIDEEDKLILPSLEKFEEDLLNNAIPSVVTAGLILYRINQSFKSRMDIDYTYKTFNIIEPVDSKRSKNWNTFLENKGIEDRANLNLIGNYLIHPNSKKFNDFPKFDLEYLEESVLDDNISTNINHTFPVSSISNLRNTIDETLRDRTSYFAKKAIEIFEF